MTDYKQLVLKEYKYWTLGLSEHQYYLGRAVAWLKRSGEMQRLSHLHPEERAELFETVIPEYEAVVGALFKVNHMNYAWLGNDFVSHHGHGHMHLIPRYTGPRMFRNETFLDENWGKNYSPYPKPEYSTELLFAIRDAIRAELNT